MKLIIRILWFIPTFALYVPIRNALESVNASLIFTWLFNAVYVLFVYFIPSNAFIAMFNKAPNRRANKLCRYIWERVRDFSTKANLDMDECTSVYIFSAFCYATLDLISMEGMGAPIKEQLLISGAKMFAYSSNRPAHMVKSQIEYGFDKMILEFVDRGISVVTPEGLSDIFELTISECVSDPLKYEEAFSDFAKTLLDVRKYASEHI